MGTKAWLVGMAVGGVLAGALASCAVDPYQPPALGSGGSGGSGASGSTASAGGAGQGGAGQGGAGQGGAGGGSTASGGMGGAGQGGAGGAGQGGGPTGCTNDDECLNHLVPICHRPVCLVQEDKCGAEPINDSVTNQKPKSLGDCATHICVNGVLNVLDDFMDPPKDGNACTADSCSPNPEPPTTCKLNDGTTGTCDSEAKPPRCIDCILGDLLPCGISTQDCVDGQCVPNSCGDGMKSTGESDIDCGGQTCLRRCADGQACFGDSDCVNGLCDTIQKSCQPPSCQDLRRNGTETGKDCGGECPTDCQDGDGCRGGADCISGVCYNAVCQVPNCYDAVHNGDEAGVDCGGSCLFACGG
jgi:hypothetical protein